MFKQTIKRIIFKRPFLYSLYKKILHKPWFYKWYLKFHSWSYSITLDFPFHSVPRWGYGKPPHSQLYKLISKNRDIYKNFLEKFLAFREQFLKISKNEIPNQIQEPYWINGWIPGLDAVALYSFLCLNNPKNYIEVGSGNSTKFARRAIHDAGLQTKIISIDPNPRAEIDNICDTVIRKGLENMDLAIFNTLEEGDILFIDGSHRVFMNSDATVFFLEVLPKLKPGVLVEIHEIFLPYDYPPEWKECYYSEQYLLATYLLSGNNRFEIILPNVFISRAPDLQNILLPLWNNPVMEGVERYGYSCWIKII